MVKKIFLGGKAKKFSVGRERMKSFFYTHKIGWRLKFSFSLAHSGKVWTLIFLGDHLKKHLKDFFRGLKLFYLENFFENL